jgi:hypothetical protein
MKEIGPGTPPRDLPGDERTLRPGSSTEGKGRGTTFSVSIPLGGPIDEVGQQSPAFAAG